MKIFLGLETGGTTCKVGIAFDDPTNLKVQAEIPTQDPSTTVVAIADWYASKVKSFDSIGVAAFGPLCLDPASPLFGYVTSTPKLAWQNFNLQGEICKLLKAKFGCDTIKYVMDTDVNSCAWMEYKFYKGISSIAYITIGTGVGIGLMVNGKLVHGLVHPEGGHMRITKHTDEIGFDGVCPFHKDCLEGLCTNNSIAKRKGIAITEIPMLKDDDKVWDYVSYYIAQACVNLTLILSIEKIVIGGGVVKQKTLLDKVKKCYAPILNRYVTHSKLDDIDNYIVRPHFEPNNGILAAISLAV